MKCLPVKKNQITRLFPFSVETCIINRKKRRKEGVLVDHPHEGHRQRVKKRFREQGLKNFEPHNVLELLLFYAIPRRDTNEIAHRLLEAFGTFSRVLDAPVEELTKVEGISENSALLLKLIPQLCQLYYEEKVHDRSDALPCRIPAGPPGCPPGWRGAPCHPSNHNGQSGAGRPPALPE